MKKLEGILPIVAAPFTETGALDEDSVVALVRHLCQSGAAALTLFGFATEFYKLTDAERARMQTLMLRETTQRTDVAGVVSITHHSHEVAVNLARSAESEGADALMLLPPFLLAPSDAAVLAHLRRVVSSVKIPVIVQYAPALTGVRLSPDVFVQLADELPNANFVKVETVPPGKFITQLTDKSGGKLKSLVGYAGTQMLDAMQRGAVGTQPGCSFTEVYVELDRRWRSGERKSFDALYQQLLPYISYWMQGVELIIAAEKHILKKRNIIASDYCRSPSYALDAREHAMIEQFMSEFAEYLKK
jgi:4-hydroxy-tetrahydrodipicolinate synthase